MKVFIDTKSHELLAGTTIDFVVALEGSGFTFDNPNQNRAAHAESRFPETRRNSATGGGKYRKGF